MAVLSLLIALDSHIDICYKSGIITTKIDESIPQRLVKSINDLGIITPEITARTLAIVNKISTINANIQNTIPTNIIPFYNPQGVAPNTVVTVPTSALVVNNVSNNLVVAPDTKENQEICIIEDFVKEWLKFRLSLCQKTEDNPRPLSQKTVDSNYDRLKNDILPYFRNNKILYLSQITEKVIEALLKSIKSQHSKNKSYIVLNMIFKYAIKKKKTKYNPVANVEKPPEKITTGKIKDEEDENYIDTDRRKIWLDKFKKENTDMSLLFAVMLLTGIRPEEACGLQWKTLDIKRKVLLVKNAYKSINVYDDNMEQIGHTRCDDKLKTDNSYRKIPLSIDDELEQLLLEHKKEQQELFKKSRAIKDRHRIWSEDEYIFLGRNYHPYVAESLSKGLRKFRIKYELERVTPYGLRKSFASYWAEQGMKDTVLQALMGHGDYSTTREFYIKISQRQIEKEIQSLNKAS